VPSADREQGPRPGDPGADRLWLRAAIALSLRCPPSDSAFSVGAVLVDRSGVVLGSGFSREEDEKDHAEEVALRRAAASSRRPAATPPGAALPGVATLPGGALLEGAPPGETLPELPEETLAGATLYSSLEPCLRRASRMVSCAELTVRAGVHRVVIAWREPPLFVPGGGAAWLTAHGATVDEYPDLAAAARAPNQHLLDA
jgi:pyrimidine deaminase RibD-like protein